MANFIATTASNQPRVSDPAAVQKILQRYRVSGDLYLGLQEDVENIVHNGSLTEQRTGVYRLCCFGDEWPDIRQVPPGIDPSEVDEDDDRLEMDALELLMQEVAPYLEEPFVVQAVGNEKCRYPLAACEWHIGKGGTEVDCNGFKGAWDEPIIVASGHPAKPDLPPAPMLALPVTDAEFHTILAALRYYQEHGQTEMARRSAWTDDLASNGGEVVPIDAAAIDRLCERINTA